MQVMSLGTMMGASHNWIFRLLDCPKMIAIHDVWDALPLVNVAMVNHPKQLVLLHCKVLNAPRHNLCVNPCFCMRVAWMRRMP